MRCSALLLGVWLSPLYVEKAWRTMWSNSAWGFLKSSHHPSPSALKGDHRTPFQPMRAFFRSVSASFSTTFCFWAAMRSFVFSLSLKWRKVCSCEAIVEKLQRNFTVLWRSQTLISYSLLGHSMSQVKADLLLTITWLSFSKITHLQELKHNSF